jgi:hypothetical protein
MMTLSVPLNSENEELIILTSDNSPLQEYSEITRIQVITPLGLLDSSVEPTLFEVRDYCIVFRFGASGLPIGLISAQLRIFTPLYPGGLFWCHFQMNCFESGVIA